LFVVLFGCDRKPDTEPDEDAKSGQAVTTAATAGPQPLDPSTLVAPVWTAPPATRRIRNEGDGELLAAMRLAESCLLAHGWFARCAEAERMLGEYDLLGNGSPGASDRPSQLGATHINDPFPAVRLFASWLLANHPREVHEIRAGDPDRERLAMALEREDESNVLAFQLHAFATDDELPPVIGDRVNAVAKRALGHQDATVRTKAIDVLAHADVRSHAGLVEPVLRAAALDSDANVRAHACRRLGVFGDARVEAWLLQRTASLDDAVAIACLEGALELAVHGPGVSPQTGAALLDRIAIAAPGHPSARTLRWLARAATRDGAASAFPRARVVAVLTAERDDTSNDPRTREAAAFALSVVDAGQAEAAPAELALLVVDAALDGPSGPANLVAYIDEHAFVPLGADIGALWDAAADAHALVITPRSDLDEQQVDFDEAHARTMLLPPSLVTLVAHAAATGAALPEIAFPPAEDDAAWAKLGATLNAFDRIADGYTTEWGQMKEVQWPTATDDNQHRARRVLAQRENLRELADHYEALRSLAPRGSEAVIAEGVARILAGDRGFFGTRRRAMALRATALQTFPPCSIHFTQPCGLPDGVLVTEIAYRILVARAKDGDIAIRKFDVSRKSVRSMLVTLLQKVAPVGATETSRVWVEVTGPFVYAGRHGDPTLWLDTLARELGDAGVDTRRIRLLVLDERAKQGRPNRIGPTTLRRILERFELHDMWYAPGIHAAELESFMRD
jgi:hypothetical protein